MRKHNKAKTSQWREQNKCYFWVERNFDILVFSGIFNRRLDIEQIFYREGHLLSSLVPEADYFLACKYPDCVKLSMFYLTDGYSTFQFRQNISTTYRTKLCAPTIGADFRTKRKLFCFFQLYQNSFSLLTCTDVDLFIRLWQGETC